MQRLSISVLVVGACLLGLWHTTIISSEDFLLSHSGGFGFVDVQPWSRRSPDKWRIVRERTALTTQVSVLSSRTGSVSVVGDSVRDQDKRGFDLGTIYTLVA